MENCDHTMHLVSRKLLAMLTGYSFSFRMFDFNLNKPKIRNKAEAHQIYNRIKTLPLSDISTYVKIMLNN